MKKLKVGKYYLVEGQREKPSALTVVCILRLAPTIQAEQVYAPVTFTLSPEKVVRRVWKLKEGVMYVCRNGEQIQVVKNPEYPELSDYAFRIFDLPDILTEYGCYWIDNSEHYRDIVSKVKLTGAQ